MMIYTGVLLMLITIFQNSSDCQQTSIPKGTNLRVGSEMIPCRGYEGQTACYQLQVGDAIGSTNWDMTYDYIENFTFVEGSIYNLKVRFVERSEPMPEDVPKIRIIVDQVLSVETP